MNDKNFLIPASLRDALVAYLSSRPFSEVNEGVTALMSLKPVEPEAEEE